MAATEELSVLADSMRQASALLTNEDIDETFLNVVALGNIKNPTQRNTGLLSRHRRQRQRATEDHRKIFAVGGKKEKNKQEMSLVDYASSSDDEDVPEPSEESPKEKEKPQRHSPQPQPQPQPPSQTLTKSGSSSNRLLENKPHSSSPLVEKLPDASLLLSSPTVSSSLMNASDHSSRVAAALAENASRKRDSNGKASSAIRSKVPRGNPPHSKNIPETAGGMLVPPQLSGRKNVVTEDISKLFVRKH